MTDLDHLPITCPQAMAMLRFPGLARSVAPVVLLRIMLWATRACLAGLCLVVFLVALVAYIAWCIIWVPVVEGPGQAAMIQGTFFMGVIACLAFLVPPCATPIRAWMGLGYALWDAALFDRIEQVEHRVLPILNPVRGDSPMLVWMAQCAYLLAHPEGQARMCHGVLEPALPPPRTPASPRRRL